MLNEVIILKVKQRLNKLSSNDYDSIENWQILEAFNKGQVDWCRRNLHGINNLREGDEQSNRRIDDMQVLLTTKPLNAHRRNRSFETDELPVDYLQWKRLSVAASSECCPKKKHLVVYLVEEGNVDILLEDYNKKPSLEWGETFATLEGNKVSIYTNNDFDINNVELTYYKQPIRIEMAGVVNPYTTAISNTNVLSPFKDDIIELFIDETVKILSGDIESMNQNQINSQSVEFNN